MTTFISKTITYQKPLHNIVYSGHEFSRLLLPRLDCLAGMASAPISDVLDMIGDTPLIHLRSLSRATRCRILAKAELSNPGGSSKDRVAAAIVHEAESSGTLLPGGTLVEATSGSTGVSLALIARARGYNCLLYTSPSPRDS